MRRIRPIRAMRRLRARCPVRSRVSARPRGRRSVARVGEPAPHAGRWMSCPGVSSAVRVLPMPPGPRSVRTRVPPSQAAASARDSEAPAKARGLLESVAWQSLQLERARLRRGLRRVETVAGAVDRDEVVGSLASVSSFSAADGRVDRTGAHLAVAPYPSSRALRDDCAGTQRHPRQRCRWGSRTAAARRSHVAPDPHSHLGQMRGCTHDGF